MNPRYRRLLIPGLLVILIVVVLITSLAREARGDRPALAAVDGVETVSTIDDPRITESSGLVLSLEHPDLAYTVNDSGSEPVLFAIKVSTGEVVGTTHFSDSTSDIEALSIDSAGRVWIADTGDNFHARSSVALYALDEPGPGDHRVRAERYALTYPDGSEDVETLLVNPKTDAKYVVSKGLTGGTVYALPEALSTTGDNEVKAVADVAALLTDGAFTPDGASALLRDYGTVRTYDAATWKQVSIAELPKQKQGETLAMEPGGESILIGSEGENSQLLRVALSAETVPTAAPSADPGDDGNTMMGTTWLIAAFVLVAGTCILLVRRRT